MKTPEDIAKIFKALCDPTRVAIVMLLNSGERCACDLTECLNIAQSKLSYHMKILCESGIIECWYQGKWTHYRINKQGSEQAMAILQELTDTNTVAEDKISCCF